MTVTELIAELGKHPGDLPVSIFYDSSPRDWVEGVMLGNAGVGGYERQSYERYVTGLWLGDDNGKTITFSSRI